MKGIAGNSAVSVTFDRNRLFIVAAIVGTFPAIALFTLGHTQGLHVHPLLNSLVYGLGILSAAFLLSWAAEALQHDISHGFALALVAIITILPEYAVDFSLVWKAGTDPVYANLAVANMTGANRLLIGLAWPLIVGIVWIKALRRTRASMVADTGHSGNILLNIIERIPGVGRLENRHGRVQLHRTQVIELTFLAAATLYVFTIPLKGRIDLFDAFILIGLFVAYMWFSSRAAVVVPNLVGPAVVIGNLEPSRRRLVVLASFAFSATVIFMSAEPFAEGLIETGQQIGISEFLLIQWVAPLASEAPEIVVACIFALRGDSASALGLLVSAKVNQWSLLIGSLPVVYSVSVGSPSALPLNAVQAQEVLLTAAQSLFAVIVMASLYLGARGAVALLVLFSAQLGLAMLDELAPGLSLPIQEERLLVFSGTYIVLAALIMAINRERRQAFIALPRRAYSEASKVTRQEGGGTQEPLGRRDRRFRSADAHHVAGVGTGYGTENSGIHMRGAAAANTRRLNNRVRPRGWSE